MLEGSEISKVHLEVQGTEVCKVLQPTLANNVVSKLLEVEMGGMAIFTYISKLNQYLVLHLWSKD